MSSLSSPSPLRVPGHRTFTPESQRMLQGYQGIETVSVQKMVLEVGQAEEMEAEGIREHLEFEEQGRNISMHIRKS